MFNRAWFRYGLVLLWMGLIFSFSATPDLRAVPWVQRVGLLPHVLSAQSLNFLEFALRKTAHMISFGVLALLVQWALALTRPDASHGRRAGVALGITLLYAISDEWHQSFVPTRVGAWTDVLIDGVGAGIVLLLVRGRAKR